MAKEKVEKKEMFGFPIRPLKRGEIKKLRAEGLDIFSSDGEQALRNVDPVLDLVFPGDPKVDDLDYPDAAKLFWAIIGATLGAEPEVKNS